MSIFGPFFNIFMRTLFRDMHQKKVFKAKGIMRSSGYGHFMRAGHLPSNHCSGWITPLKEIDKNGWPE
jgi:hypothetical protein